MRISSLKQSRAANGVLAVLLGCLVSVPLVVKVYQALNERGSAKFARPAEIIFQPCEIGLPLYLRRGQSEEDRAFAYSNSVERLAKTLDQDFRRCVLAGPLEAQENTLIARVSCSLINLPMKDQQSLILRFSRVQGTNNCWILEAHEQTSF